MVGTWSNWLWAAVASDTAVPSAYFVLLAKLAIIAAAFVLPFYLGRVLARSIRMPDYGGKLGAILCATIASIIVLLPKPAWLLLGWPPKLGIDLKGGVILVYEVDLQGRIQTSKDGPTATGDRQADINMHDLTTALSKRINPDGLKEIVIRPFGQRQVEIIIPDVDPLEIERIKKLIGQAGILQFRIVANSRDHGDVIALAVSQADDPIYGRSREVKDAKGTTVGIWAKVARDEQAEQGRKLLKVGVWRDTIRDFATGKIINVPDQLRVRFDDERGAFEQWLEREGITNVEVLMYAADGYNVMGADLAGISAGFEGLDPKVDFGTRNPEAARRMAGLTGSNLPDKGSSSGNAFRRQLGIVLDGQLLSAPAIQGTISERGQITGRFTQAEVDFLVGILRAGQLPAALNKVPVSENQIGSLLGSDMIVKSAWAIAISALAVYVFVIYYYRLAGLIAAGVLTLNIVMILALMILIQAPLTLPGLAGLVLTVGMAVDANVLIFERMREEQARGAALRMVIRNGFDRAFSTILDSNVTTVITAVILYVIGTDQVRGFAVTLTLGLVISMFTAVFCARVVFDILERKRWATQFNMRQMMAATNYDFMRIWKGFTAASVVIIVIGLVATVVRGKNMFDIDFLGGTSVQPLLKQATATDDVRDMLDGKFGAEKIQFSLTDMRFASGRGAQDYKGRVFKIDTSVRTVEELQTKLFDALKDKAGESLLATYKVNYEPPHPIQIKVSAAGRTTATESSGTSPSELPPAGQPQGEASEPSAKSDQTESAPPDKDAPSASTADQKDTEAPDSPPPSAENPATAQPCGDEPADESAPSAAAASAAQPGESPPTNDQPEAAEQPTEKPAETPAETPAAEAAEAPADERAAQPSPDTPRPAGSPGVRVITMMETKLTFETPINASTLKDRIADAATHEGISPPEVRLQHPDWEEPSSTPYTDWTVQMTGSEDEARRILAQLQKALASTPVFLSSSEVGGQVAEDTQQRAIVALLASMVGIVLYIWLRFQHVLWGVAAVLALVHDVLVMLAAVAASYWLERGLGFLMVEEFKINLTMIAAFLTLVGYSINDTIVLFDRLREIRGKSPHLTREMINQSINQTLSRTILTALTVFMVVVILYFLGGQSIHGFAFAMVVGTFAGSYSSIYIAAPVLLRMSEAEHSAKPEPVAIEK